MQNAAETAKIIPGAKKRVDIEALVRWAYRDELPKDRDFLAEGAIGFGHAWNSVSAYGELLAAVDNGGYNNWGVVPFGASVRGDPHPDALAVANAVHDLDGLTLDLPEDWAPLSDLGEMGGHGPRVMAEALDRLSVVDAEGLRRLKATPRRLVFKHAILGGCPVFEADVPEVKTVTGANGKPRWFIQREVAEDTVGGDRIYRMQEFDGWSPTAKRPLHGAYQKTVLEPDPVDAAVARGEYEIWRVALDILVADLTGAMRDHEAVVSERAYRPWEEAAPIARRVLPDLTEKVVTSAPIRRKPRQRLRAGA